MLHEVVFLYLFLPCYTSVFLFFPLREINRLTQIRLRNALGIPHYSQLSHFLSIPFISPYFKHFQCFSALRFASALATVNGEKERKREGKTRNSQLVLILSEHSAPYSEKMREKKRKRERKRYGQSEKRRRYYEKEGEYGELPFRE